jgi:lysophospholipase L1-like esterase
MNRVDPAKHPEDVAPWASWITECNRTIAAAYPNHFLDLAAWMVRPGPPPAAGYRTRDWLAHASAAQVTADLAAHVRGLLPDSLRAPGNTTHLNGTGYTIIGTLVEAWIATHGWYEAEAEKAKR